jgi:hypothetical protein
MDSRFLAASAVTAAARCSAIVRPVSPPDQQLTEEDPDRVRSFGGCNSIGRPGEGSIRR